MEFSVKGDMLTGISSGVLVGFSLSGAFKMSFFGLSQFLSSLIALSFSTPFGYFVRLLFLTMTLLFLIGAVLRLRENGVAIVYPFIFGLFLTFL